MNFSNIIMKTITPSIILIKLIAPRKTFVKYNL